MSYEFLKANMAGKQQCRDTTLNILLMFSGGHQQTLSLQYHTDYKGLRDSVCVLPQQAAVCRRRIASCCWPACLQSWPHSPQKAGWPGTNQSPRPPQRPLGSCGPQDATCGCHTHRRGGPDPAYGWNWEDTPCPVFNRLLCESFQILPHGHKFTVPLQRERQVDFISMSWSVTEPVSSCILCKCHCD